jgi:hypothetical protein
MSHRIIHYLQMPIQIITSNLLPGCIDIPRGLFCKTYLGILYYQYIYIYYIPHRHTKKNPLPCPYSDSIATTNATAMNAIVTSIAVVTNTYTVSARSINADMNPQ